MIEKLNASYYESLIKQNRNDVFVYVFRLLDGEFGPQSVEPPGDAEKYDQSRFSVNFWISLTVPLLQKGGNCY